MLLDEWEFGGGINGLTGIVARLQANTHLKLLICNFILSPTLEAQAFPFWGGVAPEAISLRFLTIKSSYTAQTRLRGSTCE